MNFYKLGLFLFGSLLFAQTKNDLWLRTTIDYTFKNPKFRIANEFQYRLQDNQNQEFTPEKLLVSYRNWFYYQENKSLKIAFSPFAYFKHHKTVVKEADIIAKPKTEIRFSAFAEFQHTFLKKNTVTHRFFTEYRWFTADNTNIFRYRQRLGLLLKLTKHIERYPNEEVFFNINQPNHFFDQNRLTAQVNIKITKHHKLETGYTYCSKNQLNTNDLIENNIFINYTLMFSSK